MCNISPSTNHLPPVYIITYISIKNYKIQTQGEIIMKSTKLFTGFAILLAITLVSGCLETGPAYKPAGYGKDVLDLYIDTEGRTTFDSMEPFIITITAENVGLFDITDVETMLIGYGGITPQDVGTSLSSLRSMADLLEKPRPEVDMLGGSATWDWDTYAPFVGEDSPDVEIMLTGEVYYRTKSLAQQKLVIVERDYLTKLAERGETIPVNPETEAKNGPVSIDVEVPNPYVRMTGDTSKFSVKLIVINDGSGNVYGRWGGGLGDYDYLEKVTLEVPAGLIADSDNCDFKIPSNNNYDSIKMLVIDEDNKKGKLRLLEGGSYRELYCRFETDSNYVNGYQTFELYAQAEYSYLQDVPRKLIILGTEEKPITLTTIFPTRGYPSNWEASPGNEAIFFSVSYKNQLVTAPGEVTTTATIAQAGMDASSDITLTNVVYKPKGKNFADVGATCIPSASEYTADETKVAGFVACASRPDVYIAGSDGPYMLNMKVLHSGETATDRSYEAINKI